MFERVSTWLLLVGFFAFSCGGGNSVTYTPAQDQAVLDRLEGTWVASSDSGDVKLTLCEDQERADWVAERDDSCDYDHIVRAEERSTRETEDHSSIGCGGCPFEVSAFLEGSVQGGELAEPVQVEVEASIGDGYDDRPYEAPYFLVGRLETDAPDQSPSMELEYEGPGALAGIVGDQLLDTQFMFTRTGPANCD